MAIHHAMLDLLGDTDGAYTHVLKIGCETARGSMDSLAARAAGLALETYGTATKQPFAVGCSQP